MNYPVAEIFTAPQGEGAHVGRAMTFVRLAGCTVGKPYTPEERLQQSLHVYQERCTDWQGNHFACDTNYKKAASLSAQDIIEETIKSGTSRLLLTGGEPLMHNIEPLLMMAKDSMVSVHVETSGTIEKALVGAYVAVSPKFGCLDSMLHRADEIKVLVGDNFDEQKFVQKYEGRFHKTFIQPVNFEHLLHDEHVRKCIELQSRYPRLRLSIQLHKVIGTR